MGVLILVHIHYVSVYPCTEFRGVVEKTNMAVTFRMNKFRMEGKRGRGREGE